MIKLLGSTEDNESIKGTVNFTVSDPNEAVIHAVRQTLLRDIELQAFGNIIIHKNDSKIQNELLSNSIQRLKINQAMITDKIHVLKITADSEFRPVYANDISETDGYFSYKDILLCVLKQGESLHIEMKLVKGTKRSTGSTAYRAMSAIGTKNHDTTTTFTGILLECFPFNTLKKMAIDYLISELKDVYKEMKNVQQVYSVGKGFIYKQTRYDYVVLNMIVEEIHSIKMIEFCATHKPHPSFPESNLIIYDKDSKELDLIKIATDSIIKRLNN